MRNLFFALLFIFCYNFSLAQNNSQRAITTEQQKPSNTDTTSIRTPRTVQLVNEGKPTNEKKDTIIQTTRTLRVEPKKEGE
jgi:hypothetical protein